MKSSSELCHGRRLRGCLPETKSALPLWLKHGPSRKCALVASPFIVTLIRYLFSVLGWVPGLITIAIAGAAFWITSITMWQYIMKNPQIKDICKSSFKPMMDLYGVNESFGQ